MEQADVPQHDFESFKQVYDETPQLQDLVKFGPNGVKVYSDSTDKLHNQSKATATTMSKRWQNEQLT